MSTHLSSAFCILHFALCIRTVSGHSKFFRQLRLCLNSPIFTNQLERITWKECNELDPD